MLGYCVECRKKHDVFDWPHAQDGEVAIRDADSPTVRDLVAGYVRLHNASDLEMRDGDLARDIAAYFLEQPHG